jgi:hypothetical protein
MLEEYFDELVKNGQTEINKIEDYKSFNYDNKKLFDLDLDFMINLYNIKIVDNKPIRLMQPEFRKGLLETHKKCIISDESCNIILEACHIIPVSENSPFCYSIDNGLLLSCEFHKTFDALLWSIDPETLCVKVSKNNTFNRLNIYDGKKLDISNTYIRKKCLQNHYERFLLKN